MHLDTITIFKQLPDNDLKKIISECNSILDQRNADRSSHPDALISEVIGDSTTGTRLKGVLTNFGIERVSDLRNYTRFNIENLRNFGKQCGNYLDIVMKEHGVKYSDEL